MQKIRYRLVYNRTKKLNKQGTALIQIEASLNQRKIYLKTNVYIQPECWNRDNAQIIDHPQANELNAMLYEYILELQSIEIGYWKRGVTSTLSNLKEAVKKGIKPYISFDKFAKLTIEKSDRKQSTKDNIKTTVGLLKEFRASIDFSDIDYSFLKDFEQFLREKSLQINTICKHMRQLRTLVNEAINQGYITQEAYPFRKFKIKKEKKEHHFLLPEELQILEKLKMEQPTLQHTLDAFLFCCYVGLRFSDFKQLNYKHIVSIDGNEWLYLDSIKTGVKLRIPVYLLFNGKAMNILKKYQSLENLSNIGCNSDINRNLLRIGKMAGIEKHFTFHTARHTCATLLVHDGAAITTVQRLLGHTSVKTTQIYSEVMDDTLVRDLIKANKKNEKRKNIDLLFNNFEYNI